jgi:hypothetical protein
MLHHDQVGQISEVGAFLDLLKYILLPLAWSFALP